MRGISVLCPNCGSFTDPEFDYPEVIADDTTIKCQSCNAEIRVKLQAYHKVGQVIIKNIGSDILVPNMIYVLQTKLVNVKHCQRCGTNHNNLKFLELFNPVDDWKYWAMCPVMDQPILLKIRQDSVQEPQ